MHHDPSSASNPSGQCVVSCHVYSTFKSETKHPPVVSQDADGHQPISSAVQPPTMPSSSGLLQMRWPRSSALTRWKSSGAKVGIYTKSQTWAVIQRVTSLTFRLSFCLPTLELLGTTTMPRATCQARMICAGDTLYFSANATIVGSDRTVSYPALQAR